MDTFASSASQILTLGKWPSYIMGRLLQRKTCIFMIHKFDISTHKCFFFRIHNLDRQIVDMAEFMLTRRLSIRMFWGLDVGRGLWMRRLWLLFWPYLFKRTNGMTNSFQIIPQLFEQYVKLKWVRLNLRGRNFEKMQYRNSQSAISTPPFLIFILWF